MKTQKNALGLAMSLIAGLIWIEKQIEKQTDVLNIAVGSMTSTMGEIIDGSSGENEGVSSRIELLESWQANLGAQVKKCPNIKAEPDEVFKALLAQLKAAIKSLVKAGADDAPANIVCACTLSQLAGYIAPQYVALFFVLVRLGVDACIPGETTMSVDDCYATWSGIVESCKTQMEASADDIEMTAELIPTAQPASA